MRFSPVALTLLLTSAILPPGIAAQSTPDGAMPSAAQPSTNIPADWTLSMEARMMRQLAQKRGQLLAAAHPSVSGCPIAFWAEREGSLGLRETRNANLNPRPGLDLSFGTGQREVVEADITVYGWSRELRIIPAAYPPQTSESFVLNGTNAAPLAQEIIWMKRLGVVNSVELTHIVFSDGTTWTHSGDLHCTVVPSKLVLVNGSAQLK